MLRQTKTFLMLAFLVLAFASVALGTAPDLEANAGATLLRIPLGTGGDGVTFDDTWNWDDGGGSSAGDGDVPLDGGGTAKVNTWLTEIIANAVYIIHKDLQFGDGSTSSFFSSKNEMVYFEDGVVFSVTLGATLSLGELSGDWGINGSFWNIGPSAQMDVVSLNVSATFLMYDSKLVLREDENIRFRGGDISLINSTLEGPVGSGLGGFFLFSKEIDNLTLSRVNVITCEAINIQTSPLLMSDILSHNNRYGVQATFVGRVVISDINISDSLDADVRTFSAIDLQIVNPKSVISSVQNNSAGSVVTNQITADIHISDSTGAPLESATVVMESFGNIVSDDAGSTFYRCTTDHTAGATFAGDSANWELTTAVIAAQAGVDGTAQNGEWITGVDYVKSETLFSVATDASGDITQQTINYKKWVGTSEALLSYAPYQFTISKTGHVTLSPDLVAPTIIDGTVQPFVEHWQLEAGATSRPRPRRHGN